MSDYQKQRSENKQRNTRVIKDLLDQGITDRGVLAEATGMRRKTVNDYLREMGICDEAKHWDDEVSTSKELYDAFVSAEKPHRPLERITVKGKTYIDITPLITDCGRE